ncbi:VOC family protein [Sphingosinicella sp. CPCC 101087]|uniref:VOC family protein n=1 Tax=Sphingosinicella sp. CPCC 101087 TaxID=2497754 RepID=UPI00101CBB2B|nr:VOC family protein [Sphingosinicella sp. CPCC 101087]
MSDLTSAPAATATLSDTPAPGTGRFFWYELMTTDQDAAARFYGEVVGWTAADQGSADPSGQRYLVLSAGKHGVAGLLQLNRTMIEGGARPGWIGYIYVPDTDEAAKRIREAGGAVHMPPQDIPGIGRFAMVADPGGAPFYVMKPLPRDDAPPPAAPNTPGHVSWHELYAADGEEAAFKFYSGQFGWETVSEMDMGPMGKYRIFGFDGVQMGGMMDKPEQVPVPSWAFYFEVDGLEAAIARIQAQGGKVTMGPHQVPGDSWIVQAVDPQGASFALVSERR